MKKNWIYSSLIIIWFVGVLCGCNNTRQTIEFRGICTDDVNGEQGLYNPGRGFRLEVAVDVQEQKENPTEGLIRLSEKYASDSVSLAQSYFYLTYTVGRELTEEHFHTMQQYFDELQKQGKKAVLRFAYEKDFAGRAPIGPTLEQALSHLDQLKPFLEKNKDLILVVQAGVIGAWGEWHSSVHGLENSDEAKIAILSKLLAVIPQDKQVQVRVPDYKNLLKKKPELYNRISFHDDFIVIRPDKWDGNMHEGTDNFNQIVNESPYLIVDGELPWGFWSVGADPDSPSTGWIIDGIQVARRLFLQHFTSLSVIHNYKEQHANRIFDENNAPEYSMRMWKKTFVNEDTLKKYRMPVSDCYFTRKNGERVERNIFDYIRDHLGYRIELQKLNMPARLHAGNENSLKLELVNRGFATVFGNHPVYYVLINPEGKVTEFPIGTNPQDWQPFLPGDSTYTSLLHTVETVLSLSGDYPKGTYQLGLWIPDGGENLKYNARYAIRCANGNTSWWVSEDNRYGVNLLTSIEVD